MRNALLTGAAGVLVLIAVWYWPRGRTIRTEQPTSVAPSAQPPSPLLDASVRKIDPLAAATLDANQLTARALQTFERDPSAALADIAQADRLGGPHDESRRALEIKALVQLGRVGHARAFTEAFYRAFPASEQCAQLERLTGSHPRPLGGP